MPITFMPWARPAQAIFYSDRAGLYTVENKSLKKYRQRGFRLDRPIYFILSRPPPALWIGTIMGWFAGMAKRSGYILPPKV